ncbi:unnamed protein product [Malus baccata var. baccata]
MKRTLDSLAELQEVWLSKGFLSTSYYLVCSLASCLVILRLFFLVAALLGKNPSVVQATHGKSGRSKMSQSSKNIDGDEDWSQISELLSRRHNLMLVHKLLATPNFWTTLSFTSNF